MFRMTRIVPTTVLTVAALALAAPAAQAANGPVILPTPQADGSFDWTAAPLGAALGGFLILLLAASVGFRRRMAA
jgi:hypothetical protein